MGRCADATPRAIRPGGRGGRARAGASRVGAARAARSAAVAAAIAAAIAAPGASWADGVGVIAAEGADRAAMAAAVAAAIRAEGARPAPGAGEPGGADPGAAARVIADAVGAARAARAAGAVPREALARFHRVRQEVDEGWRAYLRVAAETAQIRLAAARADAEVLLPWPGGAEVYADAALRLGAVLGHLGRAAESRAVLALALALDPARPITLAEFSPDVIDAVEAAGRAPAAIGRLRIATAPAGAAVRVDGADVGRAPLEVAVTLGQHVVVARAPGHLAAARVVAVGDGAAAIAIELARDEDGEILARGAAPGLDEPSAQALVDLTLRDAELTEVAVVIDGARAGRRALRLQRCAGAPARCTSAVEVGYADPAGRDAAARAAWRVARAGELRHPPAVLTERAAGEPRQARCGACRSPWLWGGIGAAVIGGVVAAVAARSAARPAPVVSIDPSQF